MFIPAMPAIDVSRFVVGRVPAFARLLVSVFEGALMPGMPGMPGMPAMPGPAGFVGGLLGGCCAESELAPTQTAAAANARDSAITAVSREKGDG
jgi:hypothetical protein